MHVQICPASRQSKRAHPDTADRWTSSGQTSGAHFAAALPDGLDRYQIEKAVLLLLGQRLSFLLGIELAQSIGIMSELDCFALKFLTDK